MISCIDKNQNEFLVDFNENENGSVFCRVFNRANECVDTFRIEANELGWASKEMIAQNKIHSLSY